MNISQFLGDVPPSNDTVIDDIWSVVNCLWYFVPVEEICDCPVQCSEINYEFSSICGTLAQSCVPAGILRSIIYEITLTTAAKFSAYEAIKTERRSA